MIVTFTPVRFFAKRSSVSTVAQLYVRAPQGGVLHPDRELKGFAKIELAAHESKSVHIDFDRYTFRHFDVAANAWKTESGEWTLDKMIELSKRIKAIVDDKAHYTDWSTREDIKANLQFDLAVILDEYGYPPVTIDDVYKEVLEQAENFKKYAS